ncbi:MAG: hypothetical protein ACRDPW_08615 [Mycobacteriales bacterium]
MAGTACLTCAAPCFGIAAAGCAQPEPAPRHVRIHDIQGPGHLSPLRGLSVADVSGVVTAVHDQGLWLQDTKPDNKADTSEGIYVYLADSPGVDVGDTVTVSGTVAEVRAGDSDSDNLTVTQLTRPKLSRTGSAELPSPIRLGSGGTQLPEQVYATATGDGPVDLERGARFDHGRNAVDAMETLEGMRVEIGDSRVLAPLGDQLPVWPAAQLPDELRTDRGSILEGSGGFDIADTGRVILDDTLAALPKATTGDSVSGPIDGVWHYAGGNYTLLPTATPGLRPGGLQPQTATRAQPYELSVASLVAEGLSGDATPSTVNAYAALITQNLRRPDIVVISGVADDSGKRDDETVSAANTFGALIAALNAGGEPRYDYRQIDPDDNADSVVPGANPRTGFLFRPDRARFVDRPGATAENATTVTTEQGRARLNHSPGRVAANSNAFDAARKAVVGEFDINGAPLFVIGVDLLGPVEVNADSPRFGRYQPPKTPAQRQRVAQAQAVHAFAKRLGDVSETARVVALGPVYGGLDSQQVQALTKDQLLRPGAMQLGQQQRYSCLRDGLAALADGAFTSPNVGSVGYQIVHTSAEFAVRVTDHDPQLVRIRASAR